MANAIISTANEPADIRSDDTLSVVQPVAELTGISINEPAASRPISNSDSVTYTIRVINTGSNWPPSSLRSSINYRPDSAYHQQRNQRQRSLATRSPLPVTTASNKLNGQLKFSLDPTRPLQAGRNSSSPLPSISLGLIPHSLKPLIKPTLIAIPRSRIMTQRHHLPTSMARMLWSVHLRSLLTRKHLQRQQSRALMSILA